MQKENLILSQKNSKPIVLDVTYKKDGTKKPIVIFCHGYKGFKDWGCWDLLAEDIAEQNIFFLKFNFSHNGGTVAQPIDFPDLNAFGENNFIKELNDLDAILDYITDKKNEFSQQIDITNITFIGHSRGGGIVLIKAQEDTRVTQVVTLAGVSDYKVRFPVGEALVHWKKEGVAYIENGRTKQKMPHFIQFYTNFMENEERLTISRAVKKLDIPYVIIHGTADETVTLAEAERLQQWQPKSKLITIENANHVFGGSHPWEENSLPNHLQEIANHIKNFVK